MNSFLMMNANRARHSFHTSSELEVRKLTAEEEENMPKEWVRILEDLNKKKLAVVFKLE